MSETTETQRVLKTETTKEDLENLEQMYHDLHLSRIDMEETIKSTRAGLCEAIVSELEKDSKEYHRVSIEGQYVKVTLGGRVGLSDSVKQQLFEFDVLGINLINDEGKFVYVKPLSQFEVEFNGRMRSTSTDA